MIVNNHQMPGPQQSSETVAEQTPPEITELIYDRATETYRASIDISMTTELSTAVVRAVALVSGVNPGELNPLSRRIDTDSLNRLFEPVPSSARAQTSVTFPYATYQITVHASGELVIAPLD